jgi:hypothetical protein
LNRVSEFHFQITDHSCSRENRYFYYKAATAADWVLVLYFFESLDSPFLSKSLAGHHCIFLVLSFLCHFYAYTPSNMGFETPTGYFFCFEFCERADVRGGT